MSDIYESLDDKHVDFINKQKLFFVATAPDEGFINLSPKGMDSFRVIDNKTVVWLNMTGSGNETAAHVLENQRMTVMFCSFDKQPLILRLYGKAAAIHPKDKQWDELISLFPDYVGARQLFTLNLDMVQGSCGYAVPHYDFVSDRKTLVNWADKTGRDGIEEYWKNRNTRSLDDKPTGIE